MVFPLTRNPSSRRPVCCTAPRLLARSRSRVARRARARRRPQPAGVSRLRLLAETILPHEMDFRGTTVGGLSALDHDPATGVWVALSDDRSELQPARFYSLRVDLSERALAVELLTVVTLRDARGQPFPKRQFGGEVVDPEAMRLLPGGRGVLWTSEGDYRSNQSPTLREARMDGTHVRDFEVPTCCSSRRGPAPVRATTTPSKAWR
jgi:hypothetical protein